MAFVVVTTVLWGRVYCGRVCAFGALTQLLDPIIPRRMRVEIPRSHREIRQPDQIRRARGRARLLPRDPRRGATGIATSSRSGCSGCSARRRCGWRSAVLLIATLFVRNLYCRFLCPVGAALGLVSQLTTVFRIKRWSECNTCKICEKTCEWGAIRGPKIVKSECVRCDDCERLYIDQKEVPALADPVQAQRQHRSTGFFAQLAPDSCQTRSSWVLVSPMSDLRATLRQLRQSPVHIAACLLSPTRTAAESRGSRCSDRDCRTRRPPG